jgi:hypothetical protein
MNEISDQPFRGDQHLADAPLRAVLGARVGPYREVEAMNHLLTGTAFAAALVIAAPVWAQANAPMARSSSAAPPSASTAAPMASKARHHQVRMRRHHVMRRGMGRQASPSDNVADQLNAQQLGRAGGPPPGMPYGRPGGSTVAPYGQPNELQGIPGAGQPSASSHPPR